jgi:signal transduction histidine kinase
MPTTNDPPDVWLSPVWVFTALLIGVTAVGVLTYVLGKNLVERSVRQRLEEVVTLKESLVQTWIEDTRNDIRVWAGSSEFSEALEARRVGRTQDAQTRRHLQDFLWRLAKTSNYVAVAVRDPATGEPWLTTRVGADSAEARQRAVAVAASAASLTRPVLDQVKAEATAGSAAPLAFFDIVSPPDGAGRAVIQVDIDPRDELFRLVKHDPGVTDTAEVLLVRRDGDAIVVLDDSRLQNPGLPSRRLAVAAAGSMWAAIDRQGSSGVVRGSDDRGHPVFAVMLPVAGTPWQLVAKLDEVEAYGELNRISALTLAMALALLVLGGWWWVANERHVATVSRLQSERVEHAERVVDLSRRVVSTQEEERHRLAMELHDRTAANLTALQLNLKSVARTVPAAGPDEQELLQETYDLLADTVVSIREFCDELRPVLLDYAGLVEAVRSSATQFERRSGIKAEVDDREFKVRCKPDVESGLFRIAQEALLNCAKHSHAKVVRIKLAMQADRLTLEIEDDGIGFDPQALGQREHGAGHGLLNMRDRAAFAGGMLSVESRPGHGTRIRFEMPWVTKAN